MFTSILRTVLNRPAGRLTTCPDRYRRLKILETGPLTEKRIAFGYNIFVAKTGPYVRGPSASLFG